MGDHPHGAGKSSFELVDAEKLFAGLDLKNDSVLLDAGCGRGNYTLAAADYIGEQGLIYAVDLWAEGLEDLRARAEAEGFGRIKTLTANLGGPLPIEDSVVDVCLMATVFHDLKRDGDHIGAAKEIGRVLKPEGVFALVEFEKIEGPPGPPKSIRLSASELEDILGPLGFEKKRLESLGPYHYLSVFGGKS